MTEEKDSRSGADAGSSGSQREDPQRGDRRRRQGRGRRSPQGRGGEAGRERGSGKGRRRRQGSGGQRTQSSGERREGGSGRQRRRRGPNGGQRGRRRGSRGEREDLARQDEALKPAADYAEPRSVFIHQHVRTPASRDYDSSYGQRPNWFVRWEDDFDQGNQR